MAKVDVSLEKEVELLRSFVIGIAGKDNEGEYKPEFVERVLRALKDKPEFEFTNSKAFLSQLDKSL